MKVAVVGDVLLDVDVDGNADRLSPDAPVPVVTVGDAVTRPGGAGLVAAMLLRDGIDVVLVTAFDPDERAARVRTLLEAFAAAPGAGALTIVAGRSGCPLPQKTRIRSSGQIVVRLDEDADLPMALPAASDEMCDALARVDAVVVADYGRGLCADPRLRAALHEAGHRVPVVWDPHPRGPAPVRSVSLVTPNTAEVSAAGIAMGEGFAGASDAARALAELWHVPAVLVTRGAAGAVLHEASSVAVHALPVEETAVGDACGAGDRLSSALVTALARGVPLAQAAASAVAAATAFVAGGGVGTLTASDTPPTRLTGFAGTLGRVQEVRARGGTVVATGGCFDLLHAGHARTLAAARALGDCLVVCLNSDDSVRRLKGPDRPIMSEADRRDLLLALACVDEVIVFDESTPEAVLERLRPDIWVKGGDYRAEELPETELLQRWGGRTVTVPYHPGRSTTNLAAALARVG